MNTDKRLQPSTDAPAWARSLAELAKPGSPATRLYEAAKPVGPFRELLDCAARMVALNGPG